MKPTKLWFASAVLLVCSGCVGTRPLDLGVTNERLQACPPSPNCVSSFSQPEDELHYIAPLQQVDSAQWQQLKQHVQALPRIAIVEDRDDYLYFESSSRLFRFVDDVELYWHKQQGRVYFRSASRLGHSDLGVNRARIEALTGQVLKP
jgi:uncharacterized protein (DUF1499 family)